MAACPKLTELTIIAPYPHGAPDRETGIPFGPAGRAHSAISELVVACKVLPYFDALQIVCIHKHTSEQQMKLLMTWTIDCLKPKTGHREEEGGKRIVLMAVRFGPGCRSVKVGKHAM